MHIFLQKIAPQHLISRLAGMLANSRCRWWKNWAISKFIKHYGVDMSQAEQPDYQRFSNFNEFFTRHLRADARPIADDPQAIISPVDGCVSELGVIEDQLLYQAKGRYYDLLSLLGGDIERAEQFAGGHFLTAYLSPKDYHRIHMPVAGKLEEMVHVPGKLFSVNPYTVQACSELFARNERVISYFNTDLGPVAMIAVGAIIVGSVVARWHGVVTPPTSKVISNWQYDDRDIQLARGEEMAHFQLGSTIIMLFPKGKIDWHQNIEASTSLKMGQAVGRIHNM